MNAYSLRLKIPIRLEYYEYVNDTLGLLGCTSLTKWNLEVTLSKRWKFSTHTYLMTRITIKSLS